MNLAQLLVAKREKILAHWQQRVSGSLHPATMPHLELVDHLPAFLDEIARALEDREGTDTSRIAAEHGVQRLGLGFSLDGVVRDVRAACP